MAKRQFQVLYREFLFRIVDLELISTDGDASRLIGQFAGLLIFVSSALGLGALLFDGRRMDAKALQIFLLGMEHFLIATTMLVVGLFAVLSWDSTFPDRRDILVLSPLPIRTRTLFLAKTAASASALGLTVISLNLCTGLTWPLRFAEGGIVGILRSLAAYWITMLSAGAFIFCSVLTTQGLAAQLLSRRGFLRLSAFLQMAAFCLFVSVYFLQPALANPRALADPQNQRALAWLPSYWFLGLFNTLNGSATAALTSLAQRASAGLAVACLGACAIFLLSYFRTLRRIAEEPDIAPGSRSLNWLPRFGASLQAAVVVFSVRTLLRSRRHRVIVAFYLGLAFAIMTAYLKTPAARRGVAVAADSFLLPLMLSSVVMLGFCVLSVRVVFALPLELPANWIFRTTGVRGGAECLAASRRALLLLAVAPAWTASAVALLSISPSWATFGHLTLLGLLGMILVDVAMYGFQKIPFTCSYLPGKSKVHMVFIAGMMIMLIVHDGVQRERQALRNLAEYSKMLAVFAIAAAFARWRTVANAKSPDASLLFEDAPQPVILGLDIHKHG